MTRRRWLLFLIIPLLALALAGVVAIALIPTDRVAALASDEASAALGREVRIDGVSLKFFPRPSVSLTGIEVAGRTQSDTPVATVGRVLLQPRLLPLLRRQVVIDAIVLDEPRVLVEIDAESVSNLPVLAQAGDSTESGAQTTSYGADPGGSLAFLVRRISINDAHLTYHDARTGTRVVVAGLDQRLSLAGDLAGGALRRIALDGEVDVPALSVAAPAHLAVPLDSLRLRVVHRAALDLAGDSLTLDRLAVTVQGLELEGAGRVHGLTVPEARTISVRLGAGPADIGAILRALPRELLALRGPDGEPVALPEFGGVLQVDVGVAGRLGGDSIPAVDGLVSLNDFSLAYGDLGEVVSALDGRIVFSLDSLVSDGIRGRLLGESLALDFAVRDLAAPRVAASLRTAVDLARAKSKRLLPDSIDAAGRIALDLRADVPVPAPAEGRVDGVVEFAGIRLRAPALQEAATIPAGKVVLAGERLELEDFVVRFGESDLAIDLSVVEWLPFVFGDTAALPRVSFESRSRLLDLDAILGPADTLGYGTLLFARLAEREVGGRPVEEVAREAGFGIPPIPPMQLQGMVRAGEVRRDGMNLRDVVVGLGANGDRLELTEARFQMMGGGIQIAAQVGMPLARGDAAESPTYPVAFSFQVQDVGAAPFFDTFTPFRDHLSGTLLLVGKGSAVLDEQLLPLRESVRASGTAAVSDGQLVNWPALQRLGQELSAVGFDTLTFKDWVSNFSISGPRIMLHQTAIAAGEVGIDAAGSLGFNGELDFGATVHLSRDLLSRIRDDLATRLSAAAAEDGRVPIGVKVAGPATSPKLELDFSVAAANVAERAKREAEERARAAAEEAARKAAEKLLPGADSLRKRIVPDSLPAAADSARARVERAAKKKLCGIIKC